MYIGSGIACIQLAVEAFSDETKRRTDVSWSSKGEETGSGSKNEWVVMLILKHVYIVHLGLSLHVTRCRPRIVLI